ncbi:hypothetical protein SASPL_142592 [Salvia splendens]|uniref:Remorin C-terminal domain-containing protein n=1 Tax=Salvia splendens TaxID=180675 RepID=A0A8X8WK68_SALSN|nr:hypothetical protein SASPL_142592 [Salvia splendens]
MDKGCVKSCPIEENAGGSSCMIKKGGGARGEESSQGLSSPRNSNADDCHLIASASQKEWAGDGGDKYKNVECDESGGSKGESSPKSMKMKHDNLLYDLVYGYKREEMRIEAWENHQKKKAEVKAEQLKSRAKEKFNQKIAGTRRVTEERRAAAEAKLNENAMKTSEKRDYIRRIGHLSSSFSFNFSCGW